MIARAYQLAVAAMLRRPTEAQVIRQQIEDDRVQQRAINMITAIIVIMALCFMYRVLNP